MALRVVFCGTPAFALPTLLRLMAEPMFEVTAVVTQPDRARGRGQEVLPSPVKEVAIEAGTPIYQPEKITSDSAFEFFERIKPDVVVIIAYGQIVPKRLIELPRLGWINLHASLLPKYRGAAPINWAIIKGERYTGVSTMQVDAGMDTGPILMQLGLKIGDDETAPQLAMRMGEQGASLVMSSIVALDRTTVIPRVQDDAQATRAPLLKKRHGLVDWHLTTGQIYNRIRGLDPWPGAYTYFRGQLCHVWGCPAEAPPNARSVAGGTLVADAGQLLVSCGEASWLRLTGLKLEGRKRITAREFENGARLTPGEMFSSTTHS
jgi:methionyl-tRNA formyltransferase